MSLLFYISAMVVIATSCCILGFYILFKDARSRIHRLFFVNSILLNTVIASVVSIQLAGTADAAVLFQCIYNICLFVFLLDSLYFNLAFTRREPNPLMKIVLGAYALTLCAVFLMYGQRLLHVTRINGLWIYELVNYPFWLCAYTPLQALIVILIVHALYRFTRTAPSHKERKQARIIMLSIMAAGLAGFLICILLPLLHIVRWPLLTPLYFAVYLHGVFFAMVKYRFMTFGIKDITKEALSHMGDMIIILDTDSSVRDANKNVAETLSVTTEDLYGKRMADLVESPDFNQVLEGFISGEEDSLRCTIAYRSTPERIMTDSVVSKVFDRFGDFTALLVISRENEGISRFRKHFNFTERQMEVILLTISGLPNNAIAERLGIAKRTVETHHFNIYNKLGISNKIELLRITGEFGIHPVPPAGAQSAAP